MTFGIIPPKYNVDFVILLLTYNGKGGQPLYHSYNVEHILSNSNTNKASISEFS